MSLWRNRLPRSSRPASPSVKPSTRWEQLFEGWRAGAIVIAVATLVSLIAIPRPAIPDDFPRPLPNRRVLDEIVRDDAKRAAAVTRDRLDYDVRAVGEAFRQYGLMDAQEDTGAVARLMSELGPLVQRALAHGPEPLLQLRAVQTLAFLEQVRAYETSGTESQDLKELGGGFAAMVKRNEWERPAGKGSRVDVPDDVRRVLFKKRWNEITGLKQGAFALAVDEQRVFFAFLLDHHAVMPQTSDRALAHSLCQNHNEYLLRKIGELGQVDNQYPMDYAAGVVLLHLGRYKAAVEPLARHLDNFPNGPWTLRTRNALRFAHQHLTETTPTSPRYEGVWR